MAETLQPYLAPAEFVDCDNPELLAWAKDLTSAAADQREAAIRLYLAVRDQVRYNPYRIPARRQDYSASATLRAGDGFCVPKATLLAAAARAVGIPARLAFADVRNHLTSERLKEMMGTDLFMFHGITELYLDGKWVKCTPTFNQSLCEKVGIHALEFDGVNDALLHPFDQQGRRHMEYVRERGSYQDLPLEEFLGVFKSHYPKLYESASGLRADDFQKEAKTAG